MDVICVPIAQAMNAVLVTRGQQAQCAQAAPEPARTAAFGKHSGARGTPYLFPGRERGCVGNRWSERGAVSDGSTDRTVEVCRCFETVRHLLRWPRSCFREGMDATWCWRWRAAGGTPTPASNTVVGDDARGREALDRGGNRHAVPRILSPEFPAA